MGDKRKIRFQGEELGEFALGKLYRMATRGDIDHTAEFWSEQAQEWRGLVGILFDFEPSKLDSIREAGITKVEILGSGSDDCPACLALQAQDYPIDLVPKLPPPDCTCVPWCRCMEVAKQ